MVSTHLKCFFTSEILSLQDIVFKLELNRLIQFHGEAKK
jgi:hypothetical protein